MAGSKKDVKAFVERWRGSGDEDQETQLFWNDLLTSCLGISPEALKSFVNYELRIRGKAPDGKYHTRKADVYIPDHRVLIEQKSLGVGLDTPRDNGIWGLETPYQQARWYYSNMTRTMTPEWIITCDFGHIRIHDLNSLTPEEDYVEVALEELPDQIHLLGFIRDKSTSRIHKEQELSVEAGGYVTKLYDALAARYHHIEDDKEEQRSLNVLITRIVFLLYAEDADLLQSHLAFGSYCQGDPRALRGKLIDLFRALNTPESERDEYDDSPASAFPYMNGGLFADESIVIPTLDEEVATTIAEASAGFNWRDISPTIFGSVFESTLNPETRSQAGMHYTSVENIHRVIDPLFLNDLKRELQIAEGLKTTMRQREALNALHNKLASIHVLDPACGSGNFLTETYLQLRELENIVIADKAILDAVRNEQEEATQQTALPMDDTIRVSIDQMRGIEINDFAVAVAKTALWISETQMLERTKEVLPTLNLDPLPLSSNDGIVEGNALTTNWNVALPAKECDYICGNPPFLGARNQSPEQKAELVSVLGDVRNVGNIDYCAGWYYKAARYMMEAGHPIRAALVSTNSICQGEQVANIWKPLYDMGIHIDYAHNTFRWGNEASTTAHVHCIIVGFSRENVIHELFIHPTPDDPAEVTYPAHINAYLKDAPDIFIWSRSQPLCDAPIMGIGNKPIDGGNYLFKDTEKDEFVRREPGSERFFHRWLGSDEFINGRPRWVLWLGGTSPADLKELPLCMERIRRVREYRLASRSAQTRRLADVPTRFHVENMPSGTSVIVPEVSSERRRYIPMGFIGPETICSNKVRLIPGGTLFHFGVLQSLFHNAWMRAVAGRLESRYQYSINVVYNNFIWPDPTPAQKADIETCAQAVLDARELYEGCTLADMYDPNNEFLYPDLMKAHRELDAAVEAAYGVDFGGDEEKIVEHLFRLYAERTS